MRRILVALLAALCMAFAAAPTASASYTNLADCSTNYAPPHIPYNGTLASNTISSAVWWADQMYGVNNWVFMGYNTVYNARQANGNVYCEGDHYFRARWESRATRACRYFGNAWDGAVRYWRFVQCRAV
jgi:hypothetical protein